MGTQGAVSEHDTKILSILREQRMKGLFTDVKIVSANAVFWAHACILAPFSLLVSKIFYSKNSEGNEEKWSTQSPCILRFPNGCDNVAEVDTSNRKFCDECIQKVIDFIYNGQISVEDSHAEHVQFIIRFLEIKNFPLKFESVLVGKSFYEDEVSSFQLTPSLKVKGTDLCKPNSPQYSDLTERGRSRTRLELKPALKTDFEHILTKTNSPQYSDLTERGRSRTRLELKPALRTDFEHILTKTNSLVSADQISLTYSDGFNNQQNNASMSQENLPHNSNYEIKDHNGIRESSRKKEKLSTDIEVEATLENPTVMKEKLLTKRKLNFSDLLCLFCPFEGSSILELLNHKLSLGHEKDTVCFLCSNDFSTNQELQMHLKEHLKFDVDNLAGNKNEAGCKSYKCGQCNKEFRWRQNFQRHLSVHDAPHKKCSKCDFVANTNYAMKYHEKKMHSDSFYSCYHENCSFKTKRKGNLKNHILSVHKKTRLSCPNCDKTFSQKKNLQRHENLYHNTLTTIHQCSMCTYVTHRADNLQKHKTSMHSSVKSNTCVQCIQDNKIIPEKFENNSSGAVSINFISLKNNDREGVSGFTQKSLDTDNIYSGDMYTNIANENNPNFSTPIVNVSCSDFSIQSPSFSTRNGRQIASLCCNGFPESSSSFSVLHAENKIQNADDQVSQIISIPHIDCKMTGTLSFNETAGTLTYHNLNSESTGALILNEITGELTYIKLVPQQSPVANPQPEPNYSSFSCVDYSDLPCEMNFSQVRSNNTDTLILNESTGELDLINQTKEQDPLDWNDRLPGRGEDDCALFDAVDEEEEENDLLDIDPADFMNESNSNSEIPVLNEWTGEINLLPNNFIGGPFLDEQTGQLSVFDLFDNDLIFDCLDEPAPSNTILNENTGEILSNNIMNEENYPSSKGNDYHPKETFGETHGDYPLFCDDLILDNDLEYSLNEATGQLSIEWPEVSEDSNFSFLLNELTGELSVKGVNG